MPSFYEQIVKPLSAHDITLFAHLELADINDEDFDKVFSTYDGKRYKTLKKFHISTPLPEKNYRRNSSAIHRHWNVKDGSGLQSMLQQIYKISEVDKFRRRYEEVTKTTFDWVFRCRYDAYYLNPIEDLNTLSNEFVYVPHHDQWGGVNDMFAFSSSKNMKIYASRYDSLDAYFDNGKRVMHPETNLLWHLQNNGVKIKYTTVALELRRHGEVWKPNFNT